MDTAELVQDDDRVPLKDIAKLTLLLRRRRSVIFEGMGKLFGEPAWDILLDLYVHHGVKFVTVKDACIAAAVPSTTAYRALKDLQNHDLIEQNLDLEDRRRQIVCLTATAIPLLEGWLRSTYEKPVKGSQGMNFGF